MCLKTEIENKYSEIPQNISRLRNTSGFLWVYTTKVKGYNGGFCWRFMKRKDGQVFTCSSTSLRGLFERMHYYGYPIVVMDTEKAEASLARENMNYDEFIEVEEVTFI